MDMNKKRLLAVILGVTLLFSGLAYAAPDEDPTDNGSEVVTSEEENGTEDDSENGEENGEESEGEENGTENGDDESENGDEDATEGDDNGDEDAEDNGDTATETAEAVVHGVERSQDGCGEGTYRNHGEYVSSTEERPRSEAARSNCGKPVHAANRGQSSNGDGDNGEDVESASNGEDNGGPGRSNGKGGGPNR